MDPKPPSTQAKTRTITTPSTGVIDISRLQTITGGVLPRRAPAPEARTGPKGLMALNVDVSEKVATRDSPTEMIATKVEMTATADISTARTQPLLQNEVKLEMMEIRMSW
ncbi:hypothetical protein PC129_g4844 [Phytophthora cactorum]|uniref:Uncharacterized protein n=1 Tax=Phytophthora cactorum TaxID=29920 RepID=A0A8T1AGZ1_9STRA|nr:hypothetical protein Pcac1_g24250 [Phytophthora cactorum]KAG2793959.1 hypothetical protein PC111_g22809 [Phytophthora cactorum]KAG2817403.1 hypothetical protein PC113_g22980 [Phytophthora cactorum]KAG2873574.1 hypothetical protein PC114_g25778 [Phytophthora cactorum]KAG2878974.1 hypothetical protein PC115_g22917 [Phytophthora cactorum]